MAKAKKASSIKRVLWAIDPFEGASQTQIQTAKTLSLLHDKIGFSVIPVYVFSPNAFNLSVAFTPHWNKEYLSNAAKEIQAVIDELPAPPTKPPKVIAQFRPSLTQSVKALLAFAKQSSADLIVMSTHARHGLPRFFVGSFTETLLLHSKTPVLSVNPSETAGLIDHILFPTDFGHRSHAVFKRVLALAKSLEARLTLFTAIPKPIDPVFDSGVHMIGSGWIPLNEYLENTKRENHEKAAAWITEALEAEVQTDFKQVDESDGTHDAIIAQAKKLGVGMIAIAAESGPVAASLVGSITRQVVRGAHCPVWILRQ